MNTHQRRRVHRRALLTLAATLAANIGLGYVAAPASAQTVLEAENASWGGTCGTEGQAQSTHAASGGATVVFLGSEGCAVTFSVSQASTVQEVRWYGGGAAGSVCGTFGVVQNGTELARTAQSCSTGGASPDDFKTPAFPANTVQAGSFQIVWHPSTSWHDAHFDWTAVAPTGTTRREAENASFPATCGSEGQATNTHGTGSGATVVFLGSSGCALTYSASTATTVKQVRWYGGGTAGSVCGAFAVSQNGTELARTASACSTGGANPDDFTAPTFPSHTVQAGSYQVIWYPSTSWHDTNVDWIETTSSGGGGGNTPPTACINNPSVTSLTASVSSCSTDPNGDPLTHTWSWGDGSANSTGSSASHTYPCAGGTYTITLTVNDGRGGTASATRNVFVSDADSDSDGLQNCRETGTYSTNPNDADSDDDGLNDGPELNQWNTKGATAWNTNYDKWATATNNLLKLDADGDGINDGVEFNQPTSIFGNCTNIGGRNECPDAGVRDVYMQVNWMNDPGSTCYFFWTCGAHSHRPSDAEVQVIRDNFANRNIGLNVRDQLRAHVYMGAAGDGSNGAVQHTTEISFSPVAGSWNDLYDYKTAHLASARVGIFHFVLFAHDEVGGAAAGRAEIYGDDVAVYHARTTTPVAVEAVWMQEIGHNLIGRYHSSCTGVNHGFFHNPSATHLNFHDADTTTGDPRFSYNSALDEGRNSDGACGVRDNLQDIFFHANDTNDAMGYGYVTGNVATTFSAATWNALRPGQALEARRQGIDADADLGGDHDHKHGPELADLLTAVTPLIPSG